MTHCNKCDKDYEASELIDYEEIKACPECRTAMFLIEYQDLDDDDDTNDGNITCECGIKFYGLEGKEDTCKKCLYKLIK